MRRLAKRIDEKKSKNPAKPQEMGLCWILALEHTQKTSYEPITFIMQDNCSQKFQTQKSEWSISQSQRREPAQAPTSTPRKQTRIANRIVNDLTLEIVSD